MYVKLLLRASGKRPKTIINLVETKNNLKKNKAALSAITNSAYLPSNFLVGNVLLPLSLQA